MASVAWPSIVEVRGDGLPRCARSDKKCVMASVARPSILEVLSDGLPRFARSDGKIFARSDGFFHSQ